MIKFLPIIFILLWSSAFITTKPIVDHSDPFAALSFRFLIVTIGFCFFSFFSKQKVLINSKRLTVLDGELLAGKEFQPYSFGELQKRLNKFFL